MTKEELKENTKEESKEEAKEEEEKSLAPWDENMFIDQPVFRRYALGDERSYEFGLQVLDQNVKIVI